MGRCPFAEWRPAPASNYSHDGKAKIGLVVHHMDGSMASADGWFRNPSSQTSAHFGIRYDGSIVQWVDTDDVAYAQCMGNWQGWVSVENESDPNRPNDGPTPEQIASMGRLIAWLGTPAVPATSMYSGGVGYHRQFPGPCSQAWGQTACPGDGFVAAIPAICAAAHPPAPAPVPAPPEVDPMIPILVTDGAFKGLWVPFGKKLVQWPSVNGWKGPVLTVSGQAWESGLGGAVKDALAS